MSFEKNFPLIWRMTATTLETALEINEGRKAFAFFNNVFSYGVVAANLPDFANECEKYNNASPEEKDELKSEIIERFRGFADHGLVIIAFEHILPLIFMNVGGGAALERAIREYKSGDTKS